MGEEGYLQRAVSFSILVCVVQVPVLLLFTSYHSSPLLEILITQSPNTAHTNINLTNSTPPAGHPPMPSSIPVSGVMYVDFASVMVFSAIAASFFSMICKSIQGDGVDTVSNVGNMEYEPGNEIMGHPVIQLWNNLFVGYTTILHVAILLLLCTPCSEYMAMTSLLVTYTFFRSLLFPKEATSSRGIPSYMIYFVLYAGVALHITRWHVEGAAHAARLQLLSLVSLADFFILGIGHTWDAVASFAVIINCRVIYAAASGMCVLFLYTRL